VSNKKIIKFPKIVFPDRGQRGKPLATTENTKALLDAFEIKPRLNLATYELELTGNDIYNGKNLSYMVTALRSEGVKVGYTISDNNLRAHIYNIATDNAYNPITAFLESAHTLFNRRNDTGSVERLFDTLTLDSKMPRNMGLELFRKWLLNAVMMAFNTLDNPKQSNGVLVFSGGEGIGKTTFIKKIFPEHIRNRYIMTDGTLNLADKDTYIMAFRNWVVELGEIDHTLKHAGANSKSFLTASLDNYRLPYGSEYEKRPRTTVFFGTTNETESLLNNFTGYRRYWILPVTAIDRNKLNELVTDDFITGLWGEVMHLYKNNPELASLSSDNLALLKYHNDSNYKSATLVEERLELCFDWQANKDKWTYNLTTAEIKTACGINVNKGIKPTLEGYGISQVARHGSKQKVYLNLPPFSKGYVKWEIRDIHGQG